METFSKILKFVVLGFVIIVFILIVLEIFSPISHNAIGNQWTLIECREYLNAVSVDKTNSPNFNFSNLSDEDKTQAFHIAGYFNFWIKTNFVWGTSSNREIVIVCQKQFDNVHKQGFWNSFQRNPAHATGYSDGSIGLISSEQFTNLNLNGFVAINTNYEFKISKP
jgi:hypothetical protein